MLKRSAPSHWRDRQQHSSPAQFGNNFRSPQNTCRSSSGRHLWKQHPWFKTQYHNEVATLCMSFLRKGLCTVVRENVAYPCLSIVSAKSACIISAVFIWFDDHWLDVFALKENGNLSGQWALCESGISLFCSWSSSPWQVSAVLHHWTCEDLLQKCSN